ncbi:MAG TPA: restriction endonuclease [Pirellulales bacterium]|jgi:hypothetical protein|nr:restriction endonuclease [Pirellulales bacterium]
MVRLPIGRVLDLLAQADASSSSPVRGSLLEQAIAELLGTVPGVEVAARNVKCVANTEEIDLLCWNERRKTGLYYLETPFLVECKNWGTPVGGAQIVNFANSMRSRACRDGILVASHGITGEHGTLTEARFELAMALRGGQRILVITREEIAALMTAADLSRLFKRKILDLTINLT